MTSTEVHIALNVLAELEDENPLLHRQLRRLLPALARDFARAGRPVSEITLKAALHTAMAAGQPIESLFTQPRPGRHPLSYEQVAYALNEWFDAKTTMDLNDTIRFGMLDSVKRHLATKNVSEDFREKAVKLAGAAGQYNMVQLLIDSSINKAYMISLAISGAYSGFNQQHHILHNLVEEYAYDYADSIGAAVQTYVSADERKLYDAYNSLRIKYQTTGNYAGEIFTGLEKWQHTAVRMADYKKIRAMLSYEMSNIGRLNQTAYKAALVLQSADRVLHYLDRWGERSKQPLKNLIDALQAPIAQNTINWPAWGDALLKYGPQVGHLMHYAHEVNNPIYNDQGEISLRLTRDHIWKTCFPLRNQNPELAELVFSLERTNKIFEEALNVWHSRYDGDMDQPGERSIPDLEFDCTKIGLPGYTLKRMPYDDLRIMFLGDYTGCCERIGDHFVETVQHATGTGESGYFVLMRGDEIKLHTWVWRGEGGQLIIDGYETKDPAITENILVDLTVEIGNTLRQPYYEDYNITDVILGISNNKFNLAPHFPIATEIASRFVCDWYFPEISQWLVTRIFTPTDYSVLTIADPPLKFEP